MLPENAFSLTCYLKWDSNDKKKCHPQEDLGEERPVIAKSTREGPGVRARFVCLKYKDKTLKLEPVRITLWGCQKGRQGLGQAGLWRPQKRWVLFVPRSAVQTPDFSQQTKWCPGASVELRINQTLVWTSSLPAPKHGLKQISFLWAQVPAVRQDYGFNVISSLPCSFILQILPTLLLWRRPMEIAPGIGQMRFPCLPWSL